MEKMSYFQERNVKNNQQIRDIKHKLPDFCSEFFMGIEDSTTPLTRLAYAHDLKCFFNFLTTDIDLFNNLSVKEFTLKDLDRLTETHIELFMSYLNSYKIGKKVYSNTIKTKSRKFATVRTMLRYFFKKNKINSNVADKLNTPKLREKEIVRLEADEVVKLLNIAESGENLTANQKYFHRHTSIRDFAILSLFLGTGIRISELVGIDIKDIDFTQNAFTVTRKGGNRVILYFSEEIKNALENYMEERVVNKRVNSAEQAFFLSMQNRRMTTRAVEKLVKKYSGIVTPLKRITPHKLRSTYGTNLYKETGDIYVVADVLGHRDVNTTKKYYAAISDDIKRAAANKVKLR